MWPYASPYTSSGVLKSMHNVSVIPGLSKIFASVARSHMLFGVLTNTHSFSLIPRSARMFASALATVVFPFT